MKDFNSHKKYTLQNLLLITLLIYSSAVFSQIDSLKNLRDDFENFKNNELNDFENYKAEENKAFAEFLKQKWKEYTIKKEIPAPLKPIPLIQPISIVKPLPQPEIDKLPKIIINPIEIKEKPSPPKYIPVNFSTQLPIIFYGNSLLIGYNKEKICYCSSVSEEGLSTYWNCMSKSFDGNFINQIDSICNNLSLNDWARYLLAKKISESIYENENDRVCFQFFVLNQINLDAKVARSNISLVLLLPTSETLYSYSYLTLMSKKYYVMSQSSGSYYTFNKSLSKDSKSLDVNFYKPLNFDLNIKKTEVKQKNGQIIQIRYNKNVTDFYNDVPQAEFKVLFNSKISSVTEEDLVREITPQIIGLNQLDAVNYLLHFVQYSFNYKTDQDQFGKEKWFYPEDMFCYPYSDCEDHSVLFAYLVKRLLNMKVIGLNYPSHVATAVLFNGNVNGDKITYKGNNYIVCDPTYIGSDAGMTMPQFKSTNPEVIEVK